MHSPHDEPTETFRDPVDRLLCPVTPVRLRAIQAVGTEPMNAHDVELAAGALRGWALRGGR